MTLTELRARYKALFYEQNWMKDEPFMRVLPNERGWKTPTHIVKPGKVPKSSKGLPLAVDLAHAFVIDPENPVWSEHWFWCRDTDGTKPKGQRIFVGVVDGRFQIHRYLHLTERFCEARWK